MQNIWILGGNVSMNEDLARLKDLDPATWERYQEDDWSDTSHVFASQIAWLQYCLQEAIAARGWLLEQSTFAAKPSAKIWKPGDAIWMLYIRYAESHVAALLAAYIAALEAQA